jgi:uncharacterized repeat protein (TIGR01451 family)
MKKILLLILALQFPWSSFGISVSIQQSWNTVCGLPNGSAKAVFFSSFPPYDVVWSNGAQLLQTMENEHLITGLAPGTYTVVVTDSNNDQASAQVVIGADGAAPVIAQLSGAGLHGCNDQCNIGRWVHQDAIHPGLIQPLVFDPPLQTLPEGLPDTYGASPWLCPSQTDFVFTVTDAMGCSVQYYSPLWNDNSTPSAMSVVSMVGGCAGGNGTVTLNGGVSVNDAYAQIWTYRVLNENGTVYTSNLSMFPGEPNNIATINNIPPGNYILERFFYNLLSPCMDQMPFTIPDLGTDCGTVTGQVWIEEDMDCVKDPGEYGFPGRVLIVMPGPHYIYTGADGLYSFSLPNGSFTISQADPLVDQLCPAQASVPFTINNLNTVTVNFGNAGAAQLDLGMTAAHGPARPGFQYALYGLARNLTHHTSGPATITLQFDPALQFVSASPAPTQVNGSTITWQIGVLGPFANAEVSAQFLVPVNTPLNSVLTSTFDLTNTITESSIANNSVQLTRIVTGSYDPNDKLVQTSSGANNTNFYIGEDEWLDYTIRFQNTGTDTAFNVVITDMLSATLDMTSFEQGASSHTVEVVFKQDRVVEWTFANVLLPDSNVNEPGSHGLVQFRIKPVSNIIAGTPITNIANIFFDFNPPVITEPSVLLAAEPGVQLQVKMMLGGPFNSGNGLMNDQLRSQGLLPLNEPYSAMGYAFINGGSGGTNSSILTTTGPNATVDWMILELRSATQPQTIVASKPVLVQRDGDLMQADGSAISFAVPAGQYHVAVKHRNHLGVMTASPISLSSSDTSINFTLSSTATWGNGARRNMNGTMVMWPGDTNGNGTISYTGPNNDRDQILFAIGGSVPTATLNNVYVRADVNLDGQVKYTGPNNDRDPILQTIGGSVPTQVRMAQLP